MGSVFLCALIMIYKWVNCTGSGADGTSIK